MTCDCFRQYKKSLTRKNVLGKTHDELLRFVFKKWIEVHDQLCNAEDRYKPGKQIRFKTSMLRSDLWDFSDVYIVVKRKTTVADPNNDAFDKKIAFQNNAPFVSCISKINNTFIDNAEDFKHCNAYVQFAWIQQKLLKNNWKFVELLQRWTK